MTTMAGGPASNSLPARSRPQRPLVVTVDGCHARGRLHDETCARWQRLAGHAIDLR